LPEPQQPGEFAAECPACGAPQRLFVFPALRAGWGAGSVSQPMLGTDEASCYFHPTRRASVACEECGRLVCGLCDCEIGAHHVCPSCLPQLEHKGAIEDLERQRTRYDLIVWMLLIVTTLFGGIFAPLTAPVVLGMVWLKWKAPGSRVDRSRLRLALATPVALAELVFGIWLWSSMISG